MNEIRTNEHGVMLRPSIADACVKRRAAEMALPEIKRWLRSGGPVQQTDEEIISSLMKFVCTHDGYEAVKAMDEDGWAGTNSELVEIMDQDWIIDAQRELTRQWARCLGITLKFQLGQRVMWRGMEGVVVNRDEELAEYGVRTPELTEKQWHVCREEDVQPVNDQECAA
jgi:hypothetical protein